MIKWEWKQLGDSSLIKKVGNMIRANNKAMLIAITLIIFGISNLIFVMVSKVISLGLKNKFFYNLETALLVLGLILLIVASVMIIYSVKNDLDRKKIKDMNKVVEGRVVSVKENSTIKVFDESPVEVFFEYRVDGKKYKGKSKYLWEEPIAKAGSKIEVYVDPYSPEKCYVEDDEL